MRDVITEKKLKEMINKSIANVLSEMANDNLTFREFASDMKDMGFTPREGEGSCKVFSIQQYGDDSNVTVHAHNNNSNVSGDVLREVKSVLEKIGWFNDKSNWKKFPFKKWGILLSSVNYDKTAELLRTEIDAANEKYKDAEVERVFPTKNSVCTLKTEKGVNLCRGENDKRPLLDQWFDFFDYDRKTGIIPCLKRDNFDTLETEAYPILQNGTLDVENMIIENVKKRNVLK